MFNTTPIFNLKSLGAFALFTLLVLSSQLAQAHPPGGGGWRGGGGGGWHGGGGVGIFFGGAFPFFPYPYPAYPYPYPYPYAYSPPPVVITQPQPQVYIEQGSGNTSSSSAGNTSAASTNNAYWYYCEASDGYYPYVKECPAGWKQVTPSPPPSTTAK